MWEDDQEQDRSSIYKELSASGVSLVDSPRGRLQALGRGIVQRRYRMATDSVLDRLSADQEGVGLQSLGRSRTATSPLANLIAPEPTSPSSPNGLTKSVSFQAMPAGLGFTTRYIDETKIQQHQARSQTILGAVGKEGRRQAAYRAASSFAKAVYWITMFTGIFGLALSGTILFTASTSTWHKDFGKAPKFRTAAVASEQEICSRVGVGLLKQGGNAVDAAMGSLLCVGAINNFSCGIGGGGFMLVRVNATYSTVIDYRETAPAAVTAKDFGKDANKLIEGGLSVAVPSQIKGIASAHARFGKLPWDQLFEPTITLCQQGFPVTVKLAKVISKWAGKIEASEAMRKTYMKQEEYHDSFQKDLLKRWVPKTESDIIKRPELAKTLRKIASEGPEAFYKGPIAEAIVRENQKHGGKLTAADLESYEVVERKPLVGSFKGFKVTTVGSPASGAPLLQILKLLEGLKLRNATSAEDKHLFIEALKFGYASRMQVADPGFNPEVLEKEEGWLKEEVIEKILKRIDHKKTHDPDYYADVYDVVHDHGTTHLSVLDRDGMAVSLTDTVNLEFGSFIMDEETGVLQNNEMGDFSLDGLDNSYGLPPSKVNFIAPGKRPVSSSTPIILERDGQVVLVTGAAGGSRIISVTAQVIMDLLLFKQDPVKAMVDSRIHHQLIPNEVVVDHGMSEEMVEGLVGYGHKVVVLPPDTSLTSLQLIMRRKNGEIWALSDPRKGGLADGY